MSPFSQHALQHTAPGVHTPPLWEQRLPVEPGEADYPLPLRPPAHHFPRIPLSQFCVRTDGRGPVIVPSARTMGMGPPMPRPLPSSSVTSSQAAVKDEGASRKRKAESQEVDTSHDTLLAAASLQREPEPEPDYLLPDPPTPDRRDRKGPPPDTRPTSPPMSLQEMADALCLKMLKGSFSFAQDNEQMMARFIGKLDGGKIMPQTLYQVVGHLLTLRAPADPGDASDFEAAPERDPVMRDLKRALTATGNGLRLPPDLYASEALTVNKLATLPLYEQRLLEFLRGIGHALGGERMAVDYRLAIEAALRKRGGSPHRVDCLREAVLLRDTQAPASSAVEQALEESQRLVAHVTREVLPILSDEASLTQALIAENLEMGSDWSYGGPRIEGERSQGWQLAIGRWLAPAKAEGKQALRTACRHGMADLIRNADRLGRLAVHGVRGLVTVSGGNGLGTTEFVNLLVPMLDHYELHTPDPRTALATDHAPTHPVWYLCRGLALGMALQEQGSLVMPLEFRVAARQALQEHPQLTAPARKMLADALGL